MTDEVARLVADIRRRSQRISSFIGTYLSSYALELMPFQAKGRIYFKAPDSFRSESQYNESEVITVRKGPRVQRYLPKRNEIWKYSLKDLPQTEPLNFGISDIRDAFFAVDEDSLRYQESNRLKNVLTHTFTAEMRNWATAGLLDTRKGFSIPYKPKGLELSVKLKVDSETGLLRQMEGSDRGGKQVFQLDYVIEKLNVDLEESLFRMDESSIGFKVINISEILLSSLNPEMAESPPSIN